MGQRRVRHRLAARLVAASRCVDGAYRAFDRLRSRAVVRLASDETLRLLNDLVYGRDRTYQPRSASFRSRLFPWEEAVLRDAMPAAPARVLVGGAGGGREVLALMERGYRVVAFEPSLRLARALQVAAPAIQVFEGAYEDLPMLRRVADPGPLVDLRSLERFDCAIFGWGSFSHLLSHEARVSALTQVASLTDGPLLVSFLALSENRRATDRRSRRREGTFSVFIGYYHTASVEEIEDLARESGLRVRSLVADSRDTNWPHAVLDRQEVAAAEPGDAPDRPDAPTERT